MTRPLRFLFVVYRWGDDLTGGAEIHHRRLVRDLLELGHDVEVWTTTGRDISPVAHWGVEWHEGYPEGMRDENGVRVRRFPLRNVRREWLGLMCRFMQKRQVRALEGKSTWGTIVGILDQGHSQHKRECRALLGFHHPEVSADGIVGRWTGKHFMVATLPATAGVLRIEGYAPRATRLREFYLRDRSHLVHGDFVVEFEISESEKCPVCNLEVAGTIAPIKDHRELGVMVRHISWKARGEQAVHANLWDDFRAFLRSHPDHWMAVLGGISATRRWSRLFDFLRGPRSPKLARALRKPPAGFDYVIAANLPWSTIPAVAKNCPLPLLAMPLWHIEDDYYYWPHYLDALKKAKLVLANTPYSAEKFFKPLGINAAFVGPGVPEMKDEGGGMRDEECSAWKQRIGVAAHEAVVLSVCRKSPEKRYDLIAEAVGMLRGEGRAVRFVLIGPDVDRRPLPDHVVHLGRVDDAELDAAYRACDVFALMSESESFGMVLAEAWMRARPVIANRLCGPAASLVEEGVDGLLASDAGELARAIASLLDDPQRACAMGEAGERKARREFTQRAATRRLLKAIAELP